VFGFELAIKPLLLPHHRHALILGTGGSSKAVAYVFRKIGIAYSFVSRHPSPSHFTYEGLNQDTIKAFEVIVNCTPLGTYPDAAGFPPIPYEFLASEHLLFDLVYNPMETVFSAKGKRQGATAQNGYTMLLLQAEKAWEIWNR
jgi:shikimate dehydrogenase